MAAELPRMLDQPPLRLLLAGATGAVGDAVLTLALADERIVKVIALTRKPITTPTTPAHPKLENVVIDFGNWPTDAPWWHVDAVICTLGATLKAAGSERAFARVDRDWPIAIARFARAAGATRYALNSSLGASAKGNFYLRTKAEAEAGVRQAGYASYTIVRPSIIDTKRTESRPGEAIGLAFARLFRPLIPRRYRAVTPERIAQALLNGVLSGAACEHVIESEELH